MCFKGKPRKSLIFGGQKIPFSENLKWASLGYKDKKIEKATKGENKNKEDEKNQSYTGQDKSLNNIERTN